MLWPSVGPINPWKVFQKMSQHCWENGKKCPKLQDFSGAKMSMIWNLNFDLMYLPGILEASTFRNKSPFYGDSRKHLRHSQLKNPLEKWGFWASQFSQQMFWGFMGVESCLPSIEKHYHWIWLQKRLSNIFQKIDQKGPFLVRLQMIYTFQTDINQLYVEVQLQWNTKTFAEKTE